MHWPAAPASAHGPRLSPIMGMHRPGRGAAAYRRRPSPRRGRRHQPSGDVLDSPLPRQPVRDAPLSRASMRRQPASAPLPGMHRPGRGAAADRRRPSPRWSRRRQPSRDALASPPQRQPLRDAPLGRASMRRQPASAPLTGMHGPSRGAAADRRRPSPRRSRRRQPSRDALASPPPRQPLRDAPLGRAGMCRQPASAPLTGTHWPSRGAAADRRRPSPRRSIRRKSDDEQFGGVPLGTHCPRTPPSLAPALGMHWPSSASASPREALGEHCNGR